MTLKYLAQEQYVQIVLSSVVDVNVLDNKVDENKVLNYISSGSSQAMSLLAGLSHTTCMSCLLVTYTE